MAEYKLSPSRVAKKRDRKKDEAGLLKQQKKILQACVETPQSARFLLEDLLGISFQTHNKRKFLQKLIEKGLLRQTELENKKSRYQTYKTTDKGREFLNSKT
jgi:predicted transcriptional regulator